MKGDKDMTNTKTVNGRRTVELRHFGALDRHAPLCGQANAWVLRNLRPMTDGSLLRREGYLPMLRLEGEVRGVFFTERNGAREGYAVAGGTVYSLSETDGVYRPLAIGTLTTQTGEVHFLRHDGCVILTDGAAAYSLSMDGASPARVYVPLYGKDWDPTMSAERAVYEQPNLLTRQLRIRYLYPNESFGLLYVNGLSIESVDGVLINGRVHTQWRYNQSTQCVEILGALNPKGTRAEVFVTMKEDFFDKREDTPWDASEVAVIGDAEQPRAVFFGGNLPTGKIWLGRETDRDERAIVRTLYPDACSFYVTARDAVTLGDGMQAVTGACRHYDRSLVFTADQAWMADGSTLESGMLRFVPVNITLGCDRTRACAVVGNHPYTLHRGRVLRWNSRTDERDECNAEIVSEPLGELIASGEARLLADPARRELWRYVLGEEGALVMREDGAWTRFDGFRPDGMFTVGNAVGFFEGQTLYRFDGDALCDVDAAGEKHPIEAEYLSRYMDLDQAGRMLRLCHATVVAECGGQEIELGVQDVRGRESRFALRGSGNDVSAMKTRAHSGRFRYLRIRLRARGEGRLRLCSLLVTARGASL